MLRQENKQSVSNEGRFGMFVFMAIAVIVIASVSNVHAATPWYAAGESHTVVLMKDGTVWTLGDNSNGQLGNGSFGGHEYEPVQVDTMRGVVAVAAGGSTSVALKLDGTVWTWGYNGSGQLGNGSTSNSNIPVRVAGLTGITAIAAGGSHVMALGRNGVVWAWGNNRLGQLGISETGTFTAPVRVGLDGVVSIASGGYHAMALKQDGTVWAWGYNGYGQLGNGTASSKATRIPAQIAGLGDVKAISAGINHSVALKRDNSLWSWGNNYYSQIGNGTTSYACAQPTKVGKVSGDVAGITAKSNHTLALMKDGTVWAWGDNGTGQWGNGIAMNGSSMPVQMRGVNETISVAAVAGVVSPFTVETDTGIQLAETGRHGERHAALDNRLGMTLMASAAY